MESIFIAIISELMMRIHLDAVNVTRNSLAKLQRHNAHLHTKAPVIQHRLFLPSFSQPKLFFLTFHTATVHQYTKHWQPNHCLDTGKYCTHRWEWEWVPYPGKVTQISRKGQRSTKKQIRLRGYPPSTLLARHARWP